MLMRERRDINKWRHILCSWIERLNIVKMSIRPKLTYRFNAVSIEIPARLFVDAEKIILKLTWKSIETRIAKTIL